MSASRRRKLLGRLMVLLMVCVLSSVVSVVGKGELSRALWLDEEGCNLEISGDATGAPKNSSTRRREDVIYGRTRRSMVDDGVVTSSQSKDKDKTKKWLLGIATGIVAGAFGAALLAYFVRAFVFSIIDRPRPREGPVIFDNQIRRKMLSFLQNGDLLTQSVLLGAGGAGRVYKATLETGNGEPKDVAIKAVEVREDEKGLFGQKQIQAELETLSSIRHRNLVALLAYVHRPDLHILIYPYMVNGSLQDALLKVEAGDLEMPWPVRHQIAVSTAEGLSYLHFHSTPRILHRDLKPSNILLDEDFDAHVSDFGLARVLPVADTHVSDSQAPGTRGYMAPEYYQTCTFTTKSDVYSFGVVLAVLLTGKDPTDDFFTTVSGGNIAGWLHSLLQTGNGLEAIHPSLRDSGEYHDEIILALKIAVFCTNNKPVERPSIREALIMLSQIHVHQPARIPLAHSSPENPPQPGPISDDTTYSG